MKPIQLNTSANAIRILAFDASAVLFGDAATPECVCDRLACRKYKVSFVQKNSYVG